MNDEVLARIDSSAPRRFLGMAMLLGLATLLLYIAVATPPALHWQVFLIVLGVAILWTAQRMWDATGIGLILTAQDLRDDKGQILVRIEDIEAVNRGAFALKPSNGFMIKTKKPQARGWQPGMWWRLGRRVAVGGVTPGSQARPMADIIAALISQRRGETL